MYTSLNPYHYCANNPILFVDVNGDSIAFAGEGEEKEEALALYNDYRSVLKELVGAEGGNKDAEVALGELGEMEGSKEVFTIKLEKMDEGKGGSFVYEGDDNFTVKVNTESDHKVGSLAHELKHGHQYLAGEVDFREKRNGKYKIGALYGYEDEDAARSRAELVGTKYPSTREQAYPGLNYGGSMQNAGKMYLRDPKNKYNTNWRDYAESNK